MLAAAGLLALAPAGRAQPPAPWREWIDGPGLTGSWGGARPALAARGLRPYAIFTSGLWSDVHGGWKTGVRYEGIGQWGLEADLDPLVGWPGASFEIGWNAYFGGQTTKALVGNYSANTVSNWEARDHVRFYHITLTQRAFDDALEIKGGLLALSDDFPDSPTIGAFLTSSFANFTSGRGGSAVPFYPVPGPGLYLRVQPVDTWRLRGGLYSANPGKDEWSNIGFDASLDDGVSLIAELATLRRPFGLQGTYTVGGFFTNRTTPEYQLGKKQRSGWMVYWNTSQELWRADGGRSRVEAVARLGIAPRQDAAVVEAYAVAGLAWFGPLPARRHDVAAVGFTWTRFASKYLKQTRAGGDRVSQREWNLELTYRVQLTPWLTLQPDLQLVLDPHQSRQDAVVLALQAVLTL